MRITRRVFLAGSLAGLATRVWSGTSLELGGLRIDTLSDGHLVLPRDFLLGDIPMKEASPILTAHGITGDAIESPCNLTLLRDGTNTVLFDAGAGPDFMQTAGTLSEAFDALGVGMDEVTHVVFTHAHPDHIWGVLDDFDDPLFSEAEHFIGAREHAYWIDPETVNSIGQARQAFAVGAARRLEALPDIAMFEDGDEVLPGVIAKATPGHTPGHMSFLVGGELLVVGDAIANAHLGFERPDWPAGSDQDPELGAATRLALLNEIAESGTRLVGFHLPEGGIGRAERSGEAFRFVPEGA